MVTGTADKTKQDAGKAQDKPKDLTAPSTGLGGKEGGAETKSGKTYQQSEMDAALARAGQKIQAKLEVVTTERDTLKSQLESSTAEITEARESIASLTKDIEAMAEDNPDKDALVKLRKEREKELKALKVEKAELAEPRREIEKWKRDQLVYSVADEFVTATGEKVDFDSFMTAADKFKLSGREGLETLAETLGFKPKDETTPEPEGPSPALISGKTEGGTINLGSLPPAELLKAIEKTLRQ